MRKGFTFPDAVLVIVLFTVVAVLAVPRALERFREREEAQVVDALRLIAAAQSRLREEGWLDRDGDGRGEFGYLADLPELPGFPKVAPDGTARVGRYLIAVLIPGPDGVGQTVGGAHRIDPDAAEEHFVAVAWPVVTGNPGYRGYAIGPDAELGVHPNEQGALAGPGLPRSATAPLKPSGFPPGFTPR